MDLCLDIQLNRVLNSLRPALLCFSGLISTSLQFSQGSFTIPNPLLCGLDLGQGVIKRWVSQFAGIPLACGVAQCQLPIE
jgi:hypothetical protein